ncbi:MAG: tRNA (adenosine(37)-N6)-threonylcarbamoyltransferase complex dimerization subunit type 1 TsaB, partial [Dehalococcoidaceae bacterium]|nr:tRNA (adenosine(37)-N6)-threonylcarbamoyltransferase complex dimerization subunit type 1 TsaB [Dehalococcoidaceae bacterium]
NIKQIGGIGVAVGPGSFNGLRAGLSTAKGLAFSLDIPIAGIPSLEAVAMGSAIAGLHIAPLLKTGSGQIAIAIYELVDRKLVVVKPPLLVSPDELARSIRRKTLFCGDIDNPIIEQLRSCLAEKAVIAGSPFDRSYARYVAQLAEDRIISAQADDVAVIEPLYLKKPHITQPRIRTGDTANLKPANFAVIWDMDGVIVDSAPLHLQAWQDTFNPLGIDFPSKYFWNTFGIKNDAIISGLGFGITRQEASRIIRSKEQRFRELAVEGIKPLPGAIELIQSLKKRRVPMAVASSAPEENIKTILGALKIRQFFKAVVGGEQVKYGKPAPEVFLKASDMLGMQPDKCIVIEDAVPGVQAAKSAGMKVIAVTGTAGSGDLAEADMVVSSLAKLKAVNLLGLLT